MLCIGPRIASTVRSLTQSGSLFAQTLHLLMQSVGPSRIVIASHSLFAQLVAGARSDDTVLSGELRASPVRALGFIAPDVSAARFGDTLLPRLTPLAAQRHFGNRHKLT